MKTLIVVAHPQLESSNIQPFFKAAIQNFDNVTWHSLTSEFDVVQERQLLTQHDRIIFQFPLYWYSAPALLKKWTDTVFSTKFATGKRYSMSGKELGIVVSTGDQGSKFQAGAEEMFTMSELLRPFEAFANKLQMHYLPSLNIHQFLYLTPDDQQRLLIHYQEYITNPEFQHFTGRVTWFKNELQHRIDSSPTSKTELEQILTVLENQQEELDDLQWNLANLKREEDS